ncbi:MAG: amino acid ABC transporter permease [Chloroflexota bacterium]|nr:amino acid ABC transporter permease [Chloroflexota bacterium]MDE2941602.1 amino acid ABC transporter permease [Chloroflexota bacterium]MDE3267221.1 amino acid ABC transporter permease [Chloroflexota bacterium]
MSSPDTTLQKPVLPPPVIEQGALGWAHANLFSNRFNTTLTVISLAILGIVLWSSLRWLAFESDWTVIATLSGRLIMGPYNTESACPGQDCFWRPQAALLLVTMLLGMGWGIAGGGLTKRYAIGVVAVLAAFSLLPYGLDEMGMDVRLLLLANIPALALGWFLARHTGLGTARWLAILAVGTFVVTLVLLRGVEGIPGMQPVSVNHWGGLMLNLLLAVAGITLSFPLGVGLALGRRSRLPVVKLLCVLFIEIFRGVPLITLLFMSQTLVPLAFPKDFPVNSLMRAGIVITLFSAAYMAENIRGGLQALHRGQTEAAQSLGLKTWQSTMFITLPQAIRNVIPAIVGQFIALFKDTTLVFIIGMQDILTYSRAFIQGNPEFIASAQELFIFLALVFWIFTYSMSHISRRIEEHLGVGRR